MTPEQLAKAQRLAELQALLTAAIASVPKEVLAGGITRVHAFKAAVTATRKLLDRKCKEPDKLYQALLAVRACGGTDIAELAKQAYS